MSKFGLLPRLAAYIGLSSVIIGIVSSQMVYRVTVKQEMHLASEQLSSLYKTVKQTISTAVYLGEDGVDLAQEVVDGLAESDIVSLARVEFQQLELTSHQMPVPAVTPQIFDLYALFEPDKVTGRLYIYPNHEFIRDRAETIATENAAAMFGLAILLMVIALAVTYFYVSSPLVRTARVLHEIAPGSNKRLALGKRLQQTELGVLVKDINLLLERAEQQIRQERLLREEVERLEQKFRMIFHNAVEPIVLTSPSGDLILQNPAFERLLESLDIPVRDNHGTLLCTLFHKPSEVLRKLEQTLMRANIAIAEFPLYAKRNGEDVWMQVVVTRILNSANETYHQVALHDVSERRAELEQLSLQAEFDQLTQLLNRRGFQRRLEQMQKQDTAFIFVLFDLNWFKRVNDRYGHGAGDELLIYVARCLGRVLEPDDIAGRWGGDEFVMLLPGSDRLRVAALCESLFNFIATPYQLTEVDVQVQIGASMGAACFPADSRDLNVLVDMADKAMYASKGYKEDPTKKYLTFTSDMDYSPTSDVTDTS
ncbi:diguanylate cyclase domain-containing protein [Bowmanella sp. JS7-9]|uniref:Diguanylate cyclase domain-containing protein n=1 Tax=Pseudobowmanella zhangzhouensis TaxID=1537679 RepID=A0ABW1XHF3_9ALTE|nr:diguanylate cyclase [Bowmanella sp. JS7-9]TBX19929.1 hypothetical protein TK45_15815 [Bowmanella sp. JS7-9]